MDRYREGDRIYGKAEGMAGTVASTWDDDQGQWLSIVWDGSTLTADDVRPLTEDD